MDDNVGTDITAAKANVRLDLGINRFFRHLASQLLHELFRAPAQAINVLADKASLFHQTESPSNSLLSVFMRAIQARMPQVQSSNVSLADARYSVVVHLEKDLSLRSR
jgi:hypothetical protein